MADTETRLTIAQNVRIEKRNDAGELYEVVEAEIDADGRARNLRVTHRVDDLAPPESYAPVAKME